MPISHVKCAVVDKHANGFGHGEFAVGVSQVLKQSQFSNRKKRFPYFRRTTVKLL
jgi:hypothetical protein